MKTYYVYILTNPGRTVLYTGFTNNLSRRTMEHYLAKGDRSKFTGRYFAYLLIYFETFSSPSEGIRREKEIKKWRREKKVNLIATMNPKWKALDFPDA